MLNALRLTAGVTTVTFAERTGFPLALIAREIALATERGLLEPDPTMIRPTPLGRRFLNDLTALFLREKAAT
jgi:oxygen-independent coproporphyrinogen-3 oxidase